MARDGLYTLAANDPSSSDDGYALRQSHPKFLIVDDEPILVRAALRALHRFEIPPDDVLKAHEPASAIELFDSFAASIRVLLTDMMMPNGTGLDIYRHVRPKRPDLAFAFWSGGMPGAVQNELAAILLQDPNVRFFEKPVPMAELTAWFRGAWLASGPA